MHLFLVAEKPVIRDPVSLLQTEHTIPGLAADLDLHFPSGDRGVHPDLGFPFRQQKKGGETRIIERQAIGAGAAAQEALQMPAQIGFKKHPDIGCRALLVADRLHPPKCPLEHLAGKARQAEPLGLHTAGGDGGPVAVDQPRPELPTPVAVQGKIDLPPLTGAKLVQKYLFLGLRSKIKMRLFPM